MKPSKNDIIEEIADEFHQFLMKGNMRALLESNPALNQMDLKRLLRIHFIISRGNDDNIGVVDFAKELPSQMKKIKTIATTHQVSLKNEVSGNVQWGPTFRERKSKGNDVTFFICSKNDKEYSNIENCILKELLEIIQNIIENDVMFAIKKKLPWCEEWFEEYKRKYIYNAIHSAYLESVTHPHSLTDHEIISTMSSRYKIYRDAAKLLWKYRQLIGGDIDKETAKELLKMTFIEPSSEDTLFELYWIIKISMLFEGRTYSLIDYDSKEIVSWVYGEYRYFVFHSKIPSEYGIKIGGIQREDNESLMKMDSISAREQKVMKKYLDLFGEEVRWRGIPDIQILKTEIDGKKMVGLTLCEIKYTSSKRYAKQGFRELLSYMAQLKINGEYCLPYDEREDLFKNMKNIRGITFTCADIELLETHRELRHIAYGSKMTIDDFI